MSRETAVTKEVTYDTQDCGVCGSEVATDPSAPLDTFEPHGYAVVLGEGKFHQEIEYEANWDKELHFELEEDDRQLPAVEGHVICEDCARSIHQHEETGQRYTGKLPRELQQNSIGSISLDQKTVGLLLGGVLVLLMLILLL